MAAEWDKAAWWGCVVMMRAWASHLTVQTNIVSASCWTFCTGNTQRGGERRRGGQEEWVSGWVPMVVVARAHHLPPLQRGLGTIWYTYTLFIRVFVLKEVFCSFLPSFLPSFTKGK
jgi:hypothetical protein